MSNLFERARMCDISILSDPLVDKVKDNYEDTPLHHLAERGLVECLSHPSVDKVKNRWGWTPLHYLASKGRVEVLEHPSVDKVKNDYETTPLYFLAHHNLVNKKWLQKRYSWYNKKFKKVTPALISEILNTPNSVRFINE